LDTWKVKILGLKEQTKNDSGLSPKQRAND
jgi:hypothetical protein